MFSLVFFVLFWFLIIYFFMFYFILFLFSFLNFLSGLSAAERQKHLVVCVPSHCLF